MSDNNTLVGIDSVKVDSKHRLLLPKKYKERFNEAAQLFYVLSPLTLVFRPVSKESNTNEDDLNNFSQIVTFDKNGRILIPKEFRIRNKANHPDANEDDLKLLTIIGRGSHLDVISSIDWEESAKEGYMKDYNVAILAALKKHGLSPPTA